MSDPQPSPVGFSPEKQHRREAFWQVYLPAILGGAVFVGICVWVVLFTIGYVPEPNLPDQQTPAAKVAIIWILLPTCFGGFIQLALLGGTVFVLSKGIRGLPGLADQILAGIQRVHVFLQRMSDRVSAPIISVASSKAGLDRFFDQVAFWKHSRRGD